MKIYNIAIAAVFATAAGAPLSAETLATLKSPDGSTTLTVSNNNGTIEYQLARGSQALTGTSTLGITTSEADFTDGLTVTAVNEKKVDTKFRLPATNIAEVADHCSEVTLEVEKDSHKAQFILRLYNEGLAWRYAMQGSGTVTVPEETGALRIPSQSTIYSLPLCQGTRSSFAEADTELLECMKCAQLPLVTGSGDNTVIIAETAPGANYCGSRLTVGADGSYTFTPVETVTANLPLATPWRMVLTAPLATVASSAIAECLADPTTVSDLSWIKPGRAASAFAGEDHTASYLDMATIRSYIDWASRQGWEYFTLDKSWRQNGISLNDVVSYAKSKNVGVFVWLSRHTLTDNKSSMRVALQQYKTAGAKGIKVEFWEDNSQASASLRNTLLKIAAEKQLMVILSNSVNTAGLNRTWPNLMTTESGLANNSYCFSPDLVSARHNINSAIMRAPFGPNDYHPVDFAEAEGKLLQSVTHAHQLALAVAFRSGVQHIADAPDNLRYSMAKEILKSLPAAWDESRCTSAIPGEYFSIVRRNGSERYIAALTAEARTAEFPLTFLAGGETVNAYIYRDGTCPTDIAFEYKTGLTSASKLSVPLAENGGVLIKLTAADNETKPYCVRYEAEAEGNTIPFGVSVLSDPDSRCSGGEFVTGAGNGRSLFINNISVPKAGTYAVTVYYMADEASDGYLKLNGELASIRGLKFINSGGNSGRALAQLTVSMPFDRTEGNSIEINSSASLPGIDRITVTDNETTVSGMESVAADPEMPGRIYSVNGAVVIEQPQPASYAVYNTLGRMLASGTMDKGTVEVPVAERGIVIVTLSAPSARFSQKLVVK